VFCLYGKSTVHKQTIRQGEHRNSYCGSPAAKRWPLGRGAPRFEHPVLAQTGGAGNMFSGAIARDARHGDMCVCAVIYHPGPALPRQRRGEGGAEQVQAKGWKALANRLKAKVTAWQAQIRGDYLARMRKHVALTTKRA